MDMLLKYRTDTIGPVDDRLDGDHVFPPPEQGLLLLDQLTDGVGDHEVGLDSSEVSGLPVLVEGDVQLLFHSPEASDLPLEVQEVGVPLILEGSLPEVRRSRGLRRWVDSSLDQRCLFVERRGATVQLATTDARMASTPASTLGAVPFVPMALLSGVAVDIGIALDKSQSTHAIMILQLRPPAGVEKAIRRLLWG